jgi:galacturan 1,4-alpha-galacturonidase
VRQTRQTCTVPAKKDGSDDSPAILAAFEKCGQGGRIVFLPETYNIARVMKTIDLKDCQVDIQGTLKVTSLSFPARLNELISASN